MESDIDWSDEGVESAESTKSTKMRVSLKTVAVKRLKKMEGPLIKRA